MKKTRPYATIVAIHPPNRLPLMAKITEKDVEYVAGLAQLSFDEDARKRLAKEMGEILTYMDQLSEVDTDGVEPMMHVLELSNVYREDKVGESLDRETIFDNAPKCDDEYFLVPRILETD